jgi:general stress protein CsbA
VFWAFQTLLPGENLLTQPSNIALFFVGVTSFLFHLTLKYETQVMDDLSMFWVCAALVHELYTLDWKQSSRLAFGTILSAVLVGISIYHYYLHQLWLHNLTFISLVTAVSMPCLFQKQFHPYTNSDMSADMASSPVSHTNKIQRRATTLLDQRISRRWILFHTRIRGMGIGFGILRLASGDEKVNWDPFRFLA